MLVLIVIDYLVFGMSFLQNDLLNGFLGWPAFHQSTAHSSPLLYDIDKDGVREIALATYNGEVLFFRWLSFSFFFFSSFASIYELPLPNAWSAFNKVIISYHF